MNKKNTFKLKYERSWTNKGESYFINALKGNALDLDNLPATYKFSKDRVIVHSTQAKDSITGRTRLYLMKNGHMIDVIEEREHVSATTFSTFMKALKEAKEWLHELLDNEEQRKQEWLKENNEQLFSIEISTKENKNEV